MSVFRLLFTCLWAVSLGIFLVYLEAGRVRAEHELLKWERLRDRAVELRSRATHRYWCAFQGALPEVSLLDLIKEEEKKERERPWHSQ